MRPELSPSQGRNADHDRCARSSRDVRPTSRPDDTHLWQDRPPAEVPGASDRYRDCAGDSRFLRLPADTGLLDDPAWAARPVLRVCDGEALAAEDGGGLGPVAQLRSRDLRKIKKLKHQAHLKDRGALQAPVVCHDLKNRKRRSGGLARNRTGVQGFAVLCVTTPPRGRAAKNRRRASIWGEVLGVKCRKPVPGPYPFSIVTARFENRLFGVAAGRHASRTMRSVMGYFCNTKAGAVRTPFSH
mgnify:CR=1 FL=1